MSFVKLVCGGCGREKRERCVWVRLDLREISISIGMRMLRNRSITDCSNAKRNKAFDGGIWGQKQTQYVWIEIYLIFNVTKKLYP